MTNDDALALAALIGRASKARVYLENRYLGNARNAAALRKRILASATDDERELVKVVEQYQGSAWSLLFEIAGRHGESDKEIVPANLGETVRLRRA